MIKNEKPTPELKRKEGGGGSLLARQRQICPPYKSDCQLTINKIQWQLQATISLKAFAGPQDWLQLHNVALAALQDQWTDFVLI